jgi:sugar phosphate isomerase/epimerase
MRSDVSPRIAMVNLFEDVHELRTFALEHGFKGVEWSFALGTLPKTPAEQSKWVRKIARLQPLDVRFHCPFVKIDLGHDDPVRAAEAGEIFQGIVRLVSKAGGGILTIHIGLGRNSTEPLSWNATLSNLRNLVQYGAENRVRVCLENLAWGWTSRPNLFEKIVRMSGAGVTFDIGHAQSCESVRSQQYAVEDFVTPHPDRVLGAHVYHEEIEGRGHIPPRQPEDMASRLDLLLEIGCPWWTLELHDSDALLQAREVVARYLESNSLSSAVPSSASPHLSTGQRAPS